MIKMSFYEVVFIYKYFDSFDPYGHLTKCGYLSIFTHVVSFEHFNIFTHVHLNTLIHVGI